MFNSKKLLCAVTGVVCLCLTNLYSMNMVSPYDPLIRPAYTNNYRFQIAFLVHAGISYDGFTNDAVKTDALKIWSCDQNALSMLDGFESDSAIGQKQIAIDADDDGQRGHFVVGGDLLTPIASAVWLRTFFKESWSVSAYLPFYVMELQRVCWRDQTKQVSDEDMRVKNLLTDAFFENVRYLAKGLDLGGWRRKGIGDLTVFGEWFRDFEQAKQLLKNVRINVRLGLSLPTGLRQDEDKIMAIPFGNDGALALPCGVGLDLHYAFHVRAGLDVQLMHVFGNTRARRVRTDAHQTDLLLLQKMSAYKDFGLTQQFSLYAQLYQLPKGCSLLFGYQFIKHGKDEVTLCANPDFSNIVANSAEYLQERTIHQAIFRVDGDVGLYLHDPMLYPRFSFFVRFPFRGKRVAVTRSAGFTLSVDF